VFEAVYGKKASGTGEMDALAEKAATA